MPSTRTKIKVNVADLIAAVEARKEVILADYKKKYDDFPEEQSKYKNAVSAALTLALINANKGILPKCDYRGSLILDVKVKQPVKPSKANTAEIDRLIATLKMATDETIAISADDAAQYLG